MQAPGSMPILVVDDEPAICDLIQEGLRHRQIPCVVATRADQARSLLIRIPFGVLLTDIAMPGANGLDLLAQARHCRPDCKVILMTGLATTQNLAEALRLGAFEYVEKPFDLGCLLDLVERANTSSPFQPDLPVRAAHAIRQADSMREASLESIQALAEAVEAKDPYTRRHSEHVARYATRLAKLMGATPEQIESIRVAALLHDIGKIGIPDHILTKPGPLTDEEFEEVRKHPTRGAEILQHITVFAAESIVVRHHHENWDGSGYPDGLKEKDIPSGSRIIQVADSIDAMLMERTYKQSYPVSRVIDELQRCSGTQFDPEIAAVAVKWLVSGPHELFLPAATTAA